jgi:hypothetical protein
VFWLYSDWHLYISDWSLHTDSEDPSCYKGGRFLLHRPCDGLCCLMLMIILHLLNLKVILDLLFELVLLLSFEVRVTSLYLRNGSELVGQSRFDLFWYGMCRTSRVRTSRIFRNALGLRCCIVFSEGVLLLLNVLENFIFFPSWFIFFLN